MPEIFKCRLTVLYPLHCSRIWKEWKTRRAIAALSLVSLFFSPYSLFAGPGSDSQQVGHSFGFADENDTFGPQGSDKDYSNGLILYGVCPGLEKDLGQDLESMIVSHLGFSGSPKNRYRLSIAQTIYTPSDKSTTTFLPDDRPYAAWIRAQGDVYHLYNTGICNLFLRAGLSFGELGEGLGEEVQNTWHNLLKIDTWHGWQNHIPDRLAIQGDFSATGIRSDKFDPIFAGWRSLSWAVALEDGFTVGNVFVRNTSDLGFMTGFFRDPIIGQDNILSEESDAFARYLGLSELWLYGKVSNSFNFLDATLDHPGTRVSVSPLVQSLSCGLEGSLPLILGADGSLKCSVRLACPVLTFIARTSELNDGDTLGGIVRFWKALMTLDLKSSAIKQEWGHMLVEVNWSS